MYYSSNSFPQLTSSTTHGHGNVFPPSFFPHHNSNEIFLHPNNVLQDANFNADPSPLIIDNAVAAAAAAAAANVSDSLGSTSNMAALQLEEDHPHCDPLGYSITKKKTRAKKDRHSLIFTAQGLRHRRVRLSIEIAHKFFNLQDTLGFDKASQTLDWLFTNSKTAIQQLKEFSNYSLPNSSSTTSECDEGSQRMLNSKIHGNGNGKKSRSLVDYHFIEKESREKARTRARERTQQKQRIRKLEGEFKKNHHNLITGNHSIRPSSENAMPVLPFSGTSLINETPWKDIIVEAILNKKPLKSSPIYEYRNNMSVAEEIRFQSELFSHY